jgi:Flp pilus assembly protein TadD
LHSILSLVSSELIIDEALAVNPANVDALNGKTLTCALSGKNEEAFLLSERAVSFNPDNARFQSTMAFILREKSQKKILLIGIEDDYY